MTLPVSHSYSPLISASVILRVQGMVTVEIVGVGGAGCRNRLARLRPDGGVARVRVHNAANGRECLIEQSVSWRVGGGLFRTFNHFTGFDADHDHIVSGHDAVVDAGRFDHQDAAPAINGADVFAPR